MRVPTRANAAAVLVTATLMAWMPSAMAAEVLDQEAAGTPSGNSQWAANSTTLAQPFIAGITGALGTVTVGMDAWSASPPRTNFTIAVYEANGSYEPIGSPLASQSFGPTEVAALATNQTATAQFTSPAMVTQGSNYAIVLSTTDGNPAYKWFEASTTTNPAITVSFSRDPQVPGSAWVSTPHVLIFATYVEPSGASGTDGGSEETFSLSFAVDPQAKDDSGDTVISGVKPGWVQLPIVPETARSSSAFLGWSTSPRFPVDRAKVQVSRGWGAIDEVIAGERMIYIPAGGATQVSGSNRFYAVWG